MGCGEKWIKNFDLSSLKLLGTAGEPINQEAWFWYYKEVGKSRCPIVDTYWSTESGAPLISSLPGCTPMKPGSATHPFFGVVPALLDDEGKELTGEANGHLVFKNAWPGMIRTVDGNHHRFTCTYFYKFPGYYCAGDAARRDSEGYYWITGRTDDLLNVSGHLLSTAQVESALCSNDIVIEAAAVSAPHAVKGECIYCYIVLRKECAYNKAIENELKTSVRNKIGAIATPEILHVVSALPKTRSGKIMRRLLKKIAIGDTDHFGDLSTIADDSVIPEICETRRIYVY